MHWIFAYTLAPPVEVIINVWGMGKGCGTMGAGVTNALVYENNSMSS